MTETPFPARDRLFALISSIPGSGSIDWCGPARALLDEIAGVPAPAPSGRALRDRIVAAIKASPFTELRTVDYAPNGPLQITVKVDDLADTLLRRLAAETQQTETPVPCSWVAVKSSHSPHDWEPQPGMDPVHCPGYRLPPMDPVHILGVEAAAPVPVEAAADGEETSRG